MKKSHLELMSECKNNSSCWGCGGMDCYDVSDCVMLAAKTALAYRKALETAKAYLDLVKNEYTEQSYEPFYNNTVKEALETIDKLLGGDGNAREEKI